MECIIEITILWTPEWKLNSVRWRLTRLLQFFISNNSCLGRWTFHIKSSMKALEEKKSYIILKIEENLFLYKRNLKNSRKLSDLWSSVGVEETWDLSEYQFLGAIWQSDINLGAAILGHTIKPWLLKFPILISFLYALRQNDEWSQNIILVFTEKNKDTVPNNSMYVRTLKRQTLMDIALISTHHLPLHGKFLKTCFKLCLNFNL